MTRNQQLKRKCEFHGIELAYDEEGHYYYPICEEEALMEEYECLWDGDLGYVEDNEF